MANLPNRGVALAELEQRRMTSTRITFKRVGAICALLVTLVYAVELLLATRMLAAESNAPFWSVGEASAENKKQIEELAASSGISIDVRHRDDVLAEMRAHRVDAVQAFQIGSLLDSRNQSRAIDIDRFLPIGAISNAVTLLCNESGRYVTYKSDEHGFRNPPGIWNAHRVEVAVVGQSFAQGYCVPDGNDFPDLLRAQFPATLNLGISGEGPLLQLGAMKEFLPQYAPRIVLWIFQEGLDLADLREEINHPLPTRYLEPAFNQRLLTRQPEVDEFLRRFMFDVEAAERAQTDTEVKPRTYGSQALSVVKLWNIRGWLAVERASDSARDVAFLEASHGQVLTEILNQAKDITGRWGGTLYFVYLPSWSRYRHHPQAIERERTTVLGLVRALQIPVIDIEPAFRSQDDPLSLFPFRRFGHYNESGNRIVADTIVEALRLQTSLVESPRK